MLVVAPVNRVDDEWVLHIFTKSLARVKFEELRSKIGVQRLLDKGYGFLRFC